jgi:SnoaL-like domain
MQDRSQRITHAMAKADPDFSAAERRQLRKLLDESDCRALIERYAYAIDWMNWPGLEALFWPDAQLDFGMWSGDRTAFIPWVIQLEEGFTRRLHMLVSPRIEISGDTGRAEAGNCTYLRRIDEKGVAQDQALFGRYQFDFARRGSEWRFSGLRFLMHGLQQFPASDNGGAPFFADGLTPGHRFFAQ